MEGERPYAKQLKGQGKKGKEAATGALRSERAASPPGRRMVTRNIAGRTRRGHEKSTKQRGKFQTLPLRTQAERRRKPRRRVKLDKSERRRRKVQMSDCQLCGLTSSRPSLRSTHPRKRPKPKGRRATGMVTMLNVVASVRVLDLSRGRAQGGTGQVGADSC